MLKIKSKLRYNFLCTKISTLKNNSTQKWRCSETETHAADRMVLQSSLGMPLENKRHLDQNWRQWRTSESSKEASQLLLEEEEMNAGQT